MRFDLLSAIRPAYMKLSLVGGVLLLISLLSPLYYLSETTNGGSYSLSAFGGSLIKKSSEEHFSPLTGYVSLSFALICTAMPFACRRLPERSSRKYVAIASSLAGVCGLMTILYFHSWLDLVYPVDSFLYQNLGVSRGLGFGYFLVWVSVGFLFLSAYVSRGLVFEVKK